jgi:hypothetical protein
MRPFSRRARTWYAARSVTASASNRARAGSAKPLCPTARKTLKRGTCPGAGVQASVRATVSGPRGPRAVIASTLIRAYPATTAGGPAAAPVTRAALLLRRRSRLLGCQQPSVVRVPRGASSALRRTPRHISPPRCTYAPPTTSSELPPIGTTRRWLEGATSSPLRPRTSFRRLSSSSLSESPFSDFLSANRASIVSLKPGTSTPTARAPPEASTTENRTAEAIRMSLRRRLRRPLLSLRVSAASSSSTPIASSGASSTGRLGLSSVFLSACSGSRPRPQSQRNPFNLISASSRHAAWTVHDLHAA